MIKTHQCYLPMYQNKKKLIILVTGGRGCEHPDTPVMMADLTVRRIKDLEIGDRVMGDDGKPRTVLRLFHGYSPMYRVRQKNADDYIVNVGHKLVIKKCKSAINDNRYTKYEKVVEMSVTEYLAKSQRFKNHFNGYKVGSIPYPEQRVLIEPYLLGVWLGDGTTIFPRLTNADSEIRDYVMDYCKRHGQRYVERWEKGAWHIGIIGDGRVGNNDFLNSLKEYNLVGNKHIPQEYISNSEEVRLQLLAGLVDTDGDFNKCGYSITQKDEGMARQIKFIADTLGFHTHIAEKTVNGKPYYRLYIGGDLWRIPCKVAHKIARQEDFSKNRDWHLSHLDVEPLGVGEYCGIMVDGNHRYLAGDGTVKRNSGKSFNTGAFIGRMTFEMGKNEDKTLKKHVILYTRYTMSSAAISVIPEFTEKLELDGIEEYFKTTATDVVNQKTGARIMFRGIKSSSGNQTAKLKSINGITTFVVDEAEEWTSEREFETIMYSIRQKGIQNRIIIMMNPTDNNHFVYRKYIENSFKWKDFDGVPVQISTHPDVLHIHTSYLDNLEHLSPKFIEQAKRMKEEDPERYAHIFMGRWNDTAEGAVFKKWDIVDEFPENARAVGLGADWGYSNDPSACVRCGIVDKDLYIDELFYDTGMLIKHIDEELHRHNEQGDFIYAESADPRLIDEVALRGHIIYPVAKTNGSILAGIEKILDFDHIFVTKRSHNVHYELRNYVWDKDKDGNYINRPVDMNNHAMDAVRYYVLGRLLGQIVQSKKLSKKNLGIF